MNEIQGASAVDITSARNPFGFRFMAPLALGSMLNPINSTLISTALVPIARDFHATVADTSLLIGGLYITSAIAQPTMGRLADRLGPRRVYLAGLYIIALCGIAGRFAPSLRALIWVRVFLGIGTSAAYPTAMKMLRHRAAVTGTELPRMALSILSMSAMSTVALGPTLGGILTGLAGWRAVFLVNLPLAILGTLLVFLWIPKDDSMPNGFKSLAHEIDFVGIGLFALFLLTGMFFVMSLAQPKWWLLGLFLMFGASLFVHSLRTEQPFIDIRMLMNNRPLTVTYLRFGATNLMVYFMLYGFSQWLQTGAGFSSSKAGFITLPMSALGALSALAGGRMKGIRNPLIFGTAGLLFAAGCLTVITSGTSTMLLVFLVLPFGLPQGICSNANQAAVYSQAPHENIGTAAGLLRTSLYMGAIMSSSMLSLVFGKRPTDHGLHLMAWLMVGLNAILMLATVLDRTLIAEAEKGWATRR